jgi:Flp pilus assembly protein TadG
MFKKFHPTNERGQTLVEFALVLPILSLLLLGVIQFGVAFNNYITLTDAVRAGARKGAVGRHLDNPQAAVEQTVRTAASDNLKPADLLVTVNSAWTQGSDVTVSASYPYDIKLLGFGVTIKSGRLTSSTTERVE